MPESIDNPGHHYLCVEQLGCRDNQPTLLTFTDRQGQELLDETIPSPDIDQDDDLSFNPTVNVSVTGVVQPAITSPNESDNLQRRIFDTVLQYNRMTTQMLFINNLTIMTHPLLTHYWLMTIFQQMITI